MQVISDNLEIDCDVHGDHNKVFTVTMWTLSDLRVNASFPLEMVTKFVNDTPLFASLKERMKGCPDYEIADILEENQIKYIIENIKL